MINSGNNFGIWRLLKERLKKLPNGVATVKPPLAPTEIANKRFTADDGRTPAVLREYLIGSAESNARFNPKRLAAELLISECVMLDAFAYALSEGIVELHWEVYCPACGAQAARFASLEAAVCDIHCAACGNDFDLHLDRDVRVTFSTTERMHKLRASRDGEKRQIQHSEDAGNDAPTRGLDLLLSPVFRKLFGGEAPSVNESLRIGRVAILFTDLRGSTAIYAERGDPQAYKMVREHFEILTRAIERNHGALVKTIGDSVMASFASGADAVRAAMEAQIVLQDRIAEIGGELILKAGVHAGTCLAVNLNNQLDFFGGAVNTAARVQGLSNGNDVVITDDVLAEIESSARQFTVIKSFESILRGLPDPVNVHRLIMDKNSEIKVQAI